MGLVIQVCLAELLSSLVPVFVPSPLLLLVLLFLFQCFCSVPSLFLIHTSSTFCTYSPSVFYILPVIFSTCSCSSWCSSFSSSASLLTFPAHLNCHPTSHSLLGVTLGTSSCSNFFSFNFPLPSSTASLLVVPHPSSSPSPPLCSHHYVLTRSFIKRKQPHLGFLIN